MGPQYWLMLLLMALKMDYCNGHQFFSCLWTIFLFFPLIFCSACFVSCPFFPFVSGRKTATRICPEKHGPLAMDNDIYVCECACVTFSHTGSSVHLMHEFRAILRWSTVSEPRLVVSRIAAAHLAAMFTMNRTPIKKRYTANDFWTTKNRRLKHFRFEACTINKTKWSAIESVLRAMANKCIEVCDA